MARMQCPFHFCETTSKMELEALAAWDKLDASCPFCKLSVEQCIENDRQRGREIAPWSSKFLQQNTAAPSTTEPQNTSVVSPAASPPGSSRGRTFSLAELPMSSNCTAVFCNLPQSQATHSTYCFQAEAYRSNIAAELSMNRLAKGERTQFQTRRDRAIATLRQMVSMKKVRFQEDGFDLDLTYITPRIIAMGFPSVGREAYFRNPIDEVERFFNTRHPNRYRVYNLCSEREYESTRFNGRFKRFPFDDHNAPSPRLIADFCRDAQQFLRENEDNTIAVHCKAGKGRTGVMVCCILMMTMPNLRNPLDAMRYFGEIRTEDGKGITIPSQARYVMYWDTMLRDFKGTEPQPRRLTLQRIQIATPVRSSGQCDLYFVIAEGGKEKFDSRKFFKSPTAVRTSDGGFDFDFAKMPAVKLNGDVKFVFYQRNTLLSDELLFSFWLNTSLCSTNESLPKSELDKANKEKKGIICAELCVTVKFEDETAVAQQDSHSSAAHDAESTHRAAPKSQGLFGRLWN